MDVTVQKKMDPPKKKTDTSVIYSQTRVHLRFCMGGGGYNKNVKKRFKNVLTCILAKFLRASPKFRDGGGECFKLLTLTSWIRPYSQSKVKLYRKT